MRNTLYPIMRRQKLVQHVSDNVLLPNSVASTMPRKTSSEQNHASKSPKWFMMKASKSKRQEEVERLDHAIQQINSDKELIMTRSKRRDNEIVELKQILREQCTGISGANIQLVGLHENINETLKSIKLTFNDEPLEVPGDDETEDLDARPTDTDKEKLPALLNISVTLAQEMNMYSNELVRLATEQGRGTQDKEAVERRKQIELEHAEEARCVLLQQVGDLTNKVEQLANESDQQKKEISNLTDWASQALQSMKQAAINSQKRKKSWFKL